MAQKLLRKVGARRKVAPTKTAVDAPKRIVLVGTYGPNQLEKWPGYYNYPLYGKDKIDVEAVKGVNELWLFSGAKLPRYFAAECLGVKTREELKEFGYKATGKGHGSGQYLLFKIKRLYAPSRDFAESVTIRTKDFAGQGATQKQLKAYLESPDRKDPLLAKMLPKIVTELPRERLRVCEAAVQLDFLGMVETKETESFPFPSPAKGKFTFIDLFAGIGGIRLGYQLNGGRCVFSSEWDKDAAKTYYYNFGERPHGDIQKIDPKTIPDFDVLLAGFPCQPFSIIGDKEGFKHETQGTLFFNIEKILLAKKPKAFMLENVRNLTAHDNGRTFKVILSHLQDAGYDVHYKVLNALDYGVPQKRERIIICGFRKKVNFAFPPPVPVEQRKTVADIIDAEAEKDKTLFVRPAIRKSRLERLKDKKFPRPYISHENVAGSITPHNFSCALRAGASANYILINDERRPSAREMLRIQGFPDEFKVVVNYGQIKHQTGNSVAVPVIRAVAQRVVAALKDL